MGKSQANAQREQSLLGEWLATLPVTWKTKTHVRVGRQTLIYAGMPLTPKQSAMFGLWSSWADARVYNGFEVWIVESKLVGVGTAYGEVLDYVQQYPQSEDYAAFAPAPIVPVVLTLAQRPQTVGYFATLGVRTISFAPSFDFAEALAKLFPAAQIPVGD